ncbi:hypothetical protein GCM10020366_45540 [Saccharopolyspora gregorii]|uniref:Uncharacterized protein n=1 Tax=Saccharopolyspora gregorii TaxID=33914 RepID=A0ABP6RUW5_9PSEU
MVLGEHLGAQPAELLGHAFAEIGVSHRDQPTERTAGYRRGVLPMQADPTGLSSPLGQLVIAAMLLVAIVVTLRWLWQNRRR